MSSQATIASLAEVIASRSKIVNTYLEKNNLPQPSLAQDAPSPDFLPQNVPDEIQKARVELIDASRHLVELTTPALSRLQQVALYSYHDASALRTIYKLGIVKLVPLEGSVSYTDLAKATGVMEDKLKRIIRYAIVGSGIFMENGPEQLSHSSLSKLMATNSDANDWVGTDLMDFFPAGVYQAEAMQKWPESVSTTNTAWQIAHSTEEDAFTFWGNRPERLAVFHGAMRLQGQEGAMNQIADVVRAFDWAALKPGTLVVDMGGSHGHMSIALAKRFPNINFVVQDLPEVIEPNKVPAELEGRLSFQAHDFFTPQTLTADVYVFRTVLHDWPDDRVLQILDNLVPYIKSGARILVNDQILTPPGTGSRYHQQYSRALDMQVLLGANARERSLQEWTELIEGGSKGSLKLEKVAPNLLSFQKQ